MIRAVLAWFCEVIAEYHQSRIDHCTFVCNELGKQGRENEELYKSYAKFLEEHQRLQGMWIDRSNRLATGSLAG